MAFEISNSRFASLHNATDALEKTGIAPVGITPDGGVYPLGYTDDLGIYTVIPHVSKWFDITPIQAATVFFSFLLIVACCSFLLAEYRGRRSWWMFAFAMFAVGLGVYVLCKHEIPYIVGGILTLLLVPWWWKSLSLRDLCFLAAITGLLVPWANFIRAHTGTGVLIFVVCIVLFRLEGIGRRIIVASVVLFFLVLSMLSIDAIISRRNIYLSEHGVDTSLYLTQHHIWHTVYIGFGYIENTLGIRYEDGVGSSKAKEVNPEVAYCTKEYFSILKQASLDVIKNHPTLVIKNVLAKSAKILLYIVIFTNIGLIALVTWKGGWKHHGPWLCAIAFTALPGIIAVPYKLYLGQMFVVCVLYAIENCRLYERKIQKILFGDASVQRWT